MKIKKMPGLLRTGFPGGVFYLGMISKTDSHVKFLDKISGLFLYGVSRDPIQAAHPDKKRRNRSIMYITYSLAILSRIHLRFWAKNEGPPLLIGGLHQFRPALSGVSFFHHIGGRYGQD